MGGHCDRGLFQGTSGGKEHTDLLNARTLSDNLTNLAKTYPLSSNGYFGKKGRGKARVIESDNPLKTAWNFAQTASYNSMNTTTISGKGIIWTMKGGGRVVFRYYSSSDGTPVVELRVNNINNLPDQKIHFTKTRSQIS
jgi:hypothetical protein